ncbi:MAG: hypothetical protein M3119_08055 [Verrucomicrobiota bacterium]|nr:hypothetical protein [Verrucomicrobiota bacterium]
MRNFLRVLICFALALFALAKVGTTKESPAPATSAQKPSEEKKATGKKADAKTLLAAAKKALAATIKTARADQGLDPKTPKNKPFWKSLQMIAKNLDTAEKGLAAKSNDFFKGIADAREAEAQMKVDWQLTDSKNKNVVENGKKLGHAIALLRTNFSKEAARKKKGGDLTAKEKAAFEKIKAGQKELLAKIKKLRKEAKKDKALEKGLRKMERQARHILKEPATVDAYISTLYLLDTQAGLVRGYEYYVDKPWRADYLTLVNLETSYDTLYVEWETSAEYEWTAVDTSVDIYENEEIEVTESVSTEETSSEESYVESASFDMSETEEEEVAEAEDTDAEVDADDEADEDSMDDDSDDEGEDMSDDDSGDDDDGGGDDDGGDDDGGE